MIQNYQELKYEGNDTVLEIDTASSDFVHLSMRFMTDTPEEVELTPEQVEKLVEQLSAWLGERAI